MEFILASPTRNNATAAPHAQEFPTFQPAELAAETTCMESLVHHRECVDASLPLEQVQRAFQTADEEFLAVVKNGRVIGLCARGHIGFVMSSRFGFALHSHQPISCMMAAHPLIIMAGTPIRTVLDQALARRGDDFHQDVVLVDAGNRLLGLIKVESLARLQSQLVSEQLDELRCQQEIAQQRNLELFQANHAARQSHGLYLGLFGSHTIGVALLDARGGIHEHNARLAELINLKEGLRESVSLAELVVASERSDFLRLLEAHAHGASAPATHEFTFNIPIRGPRLMRCSTGWIRETGQICTCLDDVTEQRALERNAMRQEKQTLLDTLVGGIAHELNNKLTPVQGFAELLGLDATGPAARYLQLITKSVGEAAKIIRQLLELSRPVAQSVAVIDLRTVLEEGLAMLRFQLRESQCEVSIDLPAESVWVEADAGQLKQVALNLMINALHAMEEKQSPVLALSVRIAGTRAQWVVKDNGCGITPENLGRIFDPFFTTKGPAQGTGLGLSICDSLIRQHGGEITVESLPGTGTSFVVSLPLQLAPRHELPVEGISANFAASGLRRGMRVLVVEDEVVVRRLMQEILTTHFGCRVETAANGKEALAALNRGPYALVLSDIRMPVMSGTEFYAHLRELQPEMMRRFIFLTGRPGENGFDAEVAQWNVPVVAKPFTLARLTEVCRPYLSALPELQPCA